MTFSRDDHWVWDFWHADDGERHHLFYLFAPTSLGDPDLRHRNARVGHATSTDLVDWIDHGEVLAPGGPGSVDASATWTGSVVRDDTGRWRMFSTGTVFLDPDAITNVETVTSAWSDDLATWTKDDLALSADPRWYETLPDGTWHEEAWRDPWVWRDDEGTWHLAITARARPDDDGHDPRDRGVVGHATSVDLVSWQAQPPLSAPGAGFAHLEVVQLVEIDGRRVVLFSCDTGHLAGVRAARGDGGGVWSVVVDSFDGPLDTAAARRVTGDELYSGRAVRTHDGDWVLLAFENVGQDGGFVGRVSDPLPLGWSPEGDLVLATLEVSA